MRQKHRVPLLYNGISQQPPNVRLANQVEDATNANFTVVEGLTRRPGSWVQQHVKDGLLPAANNRMHAIVRDQTERYLVIHNRTGSGTTIRVLELSLNRYGTVDISTDALNYLNSASPDEFRFRTIADTTFILNADAATGGSNTNGTIDATKMPMQMVRQNVGSNGTITANTAANPTVVTATAHGLVTGQTIEVTGSNSTPSIDGTRVVTVLSANTFSIPVNVTVAGTSGTYKARAYFTIGVADWTDRSEGAKTITAISSSHAITSNTVANPTLVTSNAHRLVTGDYITITGSNCGPSIDGTHYVTVINVNQFTVPINVTGPAGTAGSFNHGVPTVTCTAHGLSNGDRIFISNSDSVPSIDGWWEVTVIDADHFTIPAPTVTTAGTTGKFAPRNFGTSLTNPLPSIFADGTKISDMVYWRQRLVLLGDERILMSRSNDLLNFWKYDVTAVTDADPIDVALSSEEVSIMDFGVPIRDSIILFTKAGRQYELYSTDALSPSSVKTKPITGYRSVSVRPAVSDPQIYFGTDDGGYLTLREYTYDEVSLLSKAEDVSAHVPKLMQLKIDVPALVGVYTADTSALRTIAVAPEQGVVFLLIRDRVVGGEVFGSRIFVYRNRFVEEKQVQRAWTRWELARTASDKGIRGIHDIAVIGDHLYLLVHMGTGSPPDFFVLRISVPPEPSNETPPTPETQP